MNFAGSDRGKALEAVALTEVVKLVATVVRFSIPNFIFKRFVVVDGCTESELPWELWITFGMRRANFVDIAGDKAFLDACHHSRCPPR